MLSFQRWMIAALAVVAGGLLADTGLAAAYPQAAATKSAASATTTAKADNASDPQTDASDAHATESTTEDSAASEAELIDGVRQLTFEGRRAGEGYFSRDGKRMIFQSERDRTNPFYQIYVMDLENGDIEKVSPGTGKTTCAWIHPEGDRALFASTHTDPTSKQQQTQELEFRASGKEKRYSWDYDPEYELYETDLSTGQIHQLTSAKGYDAEASYSPDGTQIVFASNRQAYERKLKKREQEQFEIDPAYMNEIYIMNADGSDLKRLTNVVGYDGGPFFSPDGKRICWRRFAEDGATAEIYTMKTDGSDVQRLTEINAMSWAPFYHPSGDYLIFTTNKHGFANFELYLIRADGQGEPVRATFTDGFDGLPVFLPDGKRVSWTSNRTPEKQSQIFIGQWNDVAARQKLGLDNDSDDESSDAAAGSAAAVATDPAFTPADLGRHVDYLTRPELGGRLTGTEGERRATAYVAAYLESLGFEPAGQNDTFFQAFDFPAGASLTKSNTMELDGKSLGISRQWRPLSFSQTGQIDPAEIVFAGYGMVVPASEDHEEYDSYVHLDVAGKWVLVFRDMPQDITPEKRQQMARYSAPRRKATIARDRGAAGIIFVAGPTSKVTRKMIPFDANASSANISIAAVSVTDGVATELFKASDKEMADVQKLFDDGSMQMGFPLGEVTLGGSIGIERKTGTGRNVIARLPASTESEISDQVVIVGAHIDHLGNGAGGSSLARDDEREQIHVGADDNASGVAAMLEIAQYVANEQRSGRLKTKRDLVIGAWSGEELGLFGSQAYVDAYHELNPDAPQPDSAAPADHNLSHAVAHAHGTSPTAVPLTAAVATYLNLDMVGRLQEKLIIQGLGSSPNFAGIIRRRNGFVGLNLTLDKKSTGLPTDASAFVAREIPILSAFTGAHEDYHTPRDTPDKLNYEGAAQISNLFALLARDILVSDTAPPFVLDEGKQEDTPRVNLRAYLGTIPDYAGGDVKGLKLSGVAKDGPAAAAGVQGGDVITELAGRKIEDIYDYTYAIEALKIGEEVKIVVQRGEKSVELKLTPGSRD